MRTPDLQKRQRILEAAAHLFTTRPYHEVLLDDIAAEAKVGKGTLYIYFKSKDDLFLALIYGGFDTMVDRLRLRLPAIAKDAPAVDYLQVVVDELVEFAFANPQVWELTRRVGIPTGESKWTRKRDDLFEMIEQVIRRGVTRGEFSDRHPDLTARYIPSLVRAALLFSPGKLTRAILTRHILSTLTAGLRLTEPASPRRPARRLVGASPA